jgi:hypothetical protein
LDGKLWFSKASDLKKFHQRVAREKRQMQMRVRQYFPAHYGAKGIVKGSNGLNRR